MKDSIVQVKLIIGYSPKKRAAVTWLLNKLQTDFGGCTWSPYGPPPLPSQPEYMFQGWGFDDKNNPVMDRVLLVYVDILGDVDDGSLELYFTSLKEKCENDFKQASIWITFTKGKILEGPGIAKYWSG